MALETKPTVLPEFATDDVTGSLYSQNNVVEPPTAKKASGWDENEKPARQYLNWLHRVTNQWINYFSQNFKDGSITINSQENFEDAIERAGANAYQFKNEYTAIYMKAGTYDFTDCFSGGDTWGALSTNNVKHFECERGANIFVGDTPSYLNSNTSACYHKNVYWYGTDSVASAIQRSFLQGAASLTYDNCRTYNRLSNTTFNGFEGNASYNATCKYINCNIYNLTSSGAVRGFYLCDNISNPIISNIESTGSSGCWALFKCNNVSSGDGNDIENSGTGTSGAMYQCNNVSGCTFIDIDSVSGTAYGSRECTNITGCTFTDIDSSAGIAMGDYQSVGISACSYTDIQAASNNNVYGLNGSSNVSACKIYQLDTTGTGVAYGASGCNNIGDSTFEDIDTVSGNCYGIYESDGISNCKIYDLESSTGGVVYGMHTCNEISGCYLNDIESAGSSDVFGFHSCSYIDAACFVENLTAGDDALEFYNCASFAITHEIHTPLDYLGSARKSKEVKSGIWDMDTTASINVDLGLNSYAIINVNVTIVDDLGAKFPLYAGGYWSTSSLNTNITLYRTASGIFDSSIFSSGSPITPNRAIITVLYRN